MRVCGREVCVQCACVGESMLEGHLAKVCVQCACVGGKRDKVCVRSACVCGCGR